MNRIELKFQYREDIKIFLKRNEQLKVFCLRKNRMMLKEVNETNFLLVPFYILRQTSVTLYLCVFLNL